MTVWMERTLGRTCLSGLKPTGSSAQKKKTRRLTVCVDFIFGGPRSSDEWPSNQKVVDVTEPTDVGRVLGVHHHFIKIGTLTETTFDMTGYIHQSVDLYNSLKGSKTRPLKNNIHYPWWELPNKKSRY